MSAIHLYQFSLYRQENGIEKGRLRLVLPGIPLADCQGYQLGISWSQVAIWQPESVFQANARVISSAQGRVEHRPGS